MPNTYTVRKPQPGASINWGHPLAQNLTCCWPLWDTALPIHQNIAMGPPMTVGAPTAVLPTRGIFGPALALTTPSSNGCAVADNAFLDSPAITIACWFRTSSTGSYARIISRDVGGDRHFGFRMTDTNKLQIQLIFGGNPAITTSASLNDGQWHLGAFSYYFDGSLTQLALYADGVLIGTSTASVVYPGGAAQLDFGYYTGEDYTGDIDMPMIWNRALTPTEHQLLFQEPFGIFSVAPKAVYSASSGHPAMARLLIT